MNLQSQEHLLAPFDSLVWMYPESSLVKVLANVTDSARFTTVFVDLYLPFFFLFHYNERNRKCKSITFPVF